jgi:hypothetical protein
MTPEGQPRVRQVARDLGLPYQVACDPRDAFLAVEDRVRAGQTALLREICGNPFRPPTAVDAAVLAYRGGAV